MLTFLYSTNSVKMFLYYSEIAFGKLLQRIFIWENVISPSSPHTQGEKENPILIQGDRRVEESNN